ncbi:MAG: PaaX family transcriptional regulator C-terminal domain-containing protein, partial [Actinomycetota bacterium]
IVDLFGAQVAGGLYVSPRAWEPWVMATARGHDVERCIMTAQAPTLRVGGADSPDAIAELLWDVDGLEHRYGEFVDVWSPALSEASAPADSLRAAFAASRELEVLLRDDPLLPSELAPGSNAARARALYVELLDVFAEHDAVARANMFRSYRAVIDRALAQTAHEFWAWAYEHTSEPSRSQST